MNTTADGVKMNRFLNRRIGVGGMIAEGIGFAAIMAAIVFACCMG